MTDELRAKMQPFMADLVWIEHVGARGFASLATKAPTPTIKEIYRYFHAEEQKHANAELALMKRWGMLDEDGSMPEPNINVKMAIKVLDDFGDTLPLTGLADADPAARVRARRGAGEVPARRDRATRSATRCSGTSTPTRRGTSPWTSRCWS